jgi:hypothetical protein
MGKDPLGLLTPFMAAIGDQSATELIERGERGTLTSDRMREISDENDQVAEAMNQMGVLPPWAASAYGNAVRSIALIGAGAGVAGFPGLLASIGATAAADANLDGVKAGLKGKELALYTLASGLIEPAIVVAFNAAGMPGVEKLFTRAGQRQVQRGIRGAIKDFGNRLSQELPEEITTVIAEATAGQIAGIDPQALAGDNLEELVKETVVMTIATTMLMGVPGGIRGGAQSAADALRKRRGGIDDTVLDAIAQRLRETNPEGVEALISTDGDVSRQSLSDLFEGADLLKLNKGQRNKLRDKLRPQPAEKGGDPNGRKEEGLRDEGQVTRETPEPGGEAGPDTTTGQPPPPDGSPTPIDPTTQPEPPGAAPTQPPQVTPESARMRVAIREADMRRFVLNEDQDHDLGSLSDSTGQPARPNTMDDAAISEAIQAVQGRLEDARRTAEESFLQPDPALIAQALHELQVLVEDHALLTREQTRRTTAKNNPTNPRRLQGPMGKSGVALESDGTSHPHFYTIVPLDELTASHTATDAVNPKYKIGGAQNRKGVRDRAMKYGAKWDPKRAIQDNVTSDGAPGITDDGHVIYGNARILAMQAFTKIEGLLAYVEELMARAEDFGISASDIQAIVDSGRTPVLVRAHDTSKMTPKQLESMGNGMNMPTMDAMTFNEVAAAISKALDDKALMDFVMLGENDTLASAIKKPKFVEWMIRKFHEMGMSTIQPTYFETKDGVESVNAAGIVLFQKVILEKMVGNPDLVSWLVTEAPSGVREKVENAIAQMLRLEKVGPKWSVQNGLQEALDAIRTTTRHDGETDADYYSRMIGEEDVFGLSKGPAYSISQQGKDVLKTLVQKGKKNALKSLLVEYEGHSRVDPEEQVFGDTMTPEQAWDSSASGLRGEMRSGMAKSSLGQILTDRFLAGNLKDFEDAGIVARLTAPLSELDSWEVMDRARVRGIENADKKSRSELEKLIREAEKGGTKPTATEAKKPAPAAKPTVPVVEPEAPKVDPKLNSAVEILKQAKVSVEQKGSEYLLKGKTHAIKDKIKEAGGRWDGRSKEWRLAAEGLAKLGSLLEEDGSGTEGTGGQEGDGEGDSELARIRKAVDARPDRSGLGGLAGQLVSQETQGLLRRGLKYGMPADVIDAQIEDVAKIKKAFLDKVHRIFLLASEPGSGKTFVLGAAIRELKAAGAKRIVYVTLRRELVDQIKKDLAEYGIDGVEFITYPEMRTGKVAASDILIFDEAHSIKNVDSQGAQQAKAAAKWISKAQFTIMSTATPFENPKQAQYLESTGVFDVFEGFDNFARLHGVRIEKFTTKTGNVVKKYIWERTKGSDELAKKARDFFVKEGIFTSRPTRLPEGMVDARMMKVKADPDWVEVYKQISLAADKMGPRLMGFGSAWVANFKKRILEMSKVNHAIAEAKSAIDRGRNPIIFVETKAERTINIPDIQERLDQYERAVVEAMQTNDTPPNRSDFGLPPAGVAETLIEYMNATGQEVIEIPSAEDMIRTALGANNVAIFTGSVTPKKAQENLDAWRSGEKKVIVATMAKGGTGLSLHDTKGNHPTTQIIVNLPWTATQVKQVAQRNARYGLASKAELVWVFSEDISFDRELASRVGGRMADMGASVYGDVIPEAKKIEDFDFEAEPFTEDFKTAPAPPATPAAPEATAQEAEAARVKALEKMASNPNIEGFDQTSGGLTATPGAWNSAGSVPTPRVRRETERRRSIPPAVQGMIRSAGVKPEDLAVRQPMSEGQKGAVALASRIGIELRFIARRDGEPLGLPAAYDPQVPNEIWVDYNSPMPAMDAFTHEAAHRALAGDPALAERVAQVLGGDKVEAAARKYVEEMQAANQALVDPDVAAKDAKDVVEKLNSDSLLRREEGIARIVQNVDLTKFLYNRNKKAFLRFFDAITKGFRRARISLFGLGSPEEKATMMIVRRLEALARDAGRDIPIEPRIRYATPTEGTPPASQPAPDRSSMSRGELENAIRATGDNSALGSMSKAQLQTLLESREAQAASAESVRMHDPIPPPNPSPGLFAMIDLVSLTEALLKGKLPKVLRAISRRPNALGVYRTGEDSSIELRADIFRGPTIMSGTAKGSNAPRVAKDVMRHAVARVALSEGIWTEEQVTEYLAKGVAPEGFDLMNLPQRRTETEIGVRLSRTPLDPENASLDDILFDVAVVIDQTKDSNKRSVTAYLVDPTYAERVLEHEIGHVIDDAPDGLGGRGNILGRLASLKKWLAGSITVEPPPTSITPEDRKRMRKEAVAEAKALADGDKELFKSLASEFYAEKIREFAEEQGFVLRDDIRQELEELSFWWRPISEEAKLNPGFMRYRKSGTELYADLWSVLLNDPATAQERAPQSVELMMAYLHRKPDFLQEYNEIRAQIDTGKSIGHARARLRAGMMDVQTEWTRRFEAESSPMREALSQIGDILRTAFMDMGWAVKKPWLLLPNEMKDKVRDFTRSWDDAIYSGAVNQAYRIEATTMVHGVLSAAGVSTESFNEYLIHMRVISSRGNMANPAGFTSETSREALQEMRGRMGDAKMEAMEEARMAFKQIRNRLVIDRLKKEGVLDDATMELVANDDYYAKFEVAERILDDAQGKAVRRGAGIKKMLGTFKTIAPPFEATLMADFALLKFLAWNRAKIEYVRGMEEITGESATPAESYFAEGRRQFKTDGSEGAGVITFMRNGKLEGYVVEEDAAWAFERRSDRTLSKVNSLMQIIGFPRLIFTAANPGFWEWNIPRDFWRTLANTPTHSRVPFAKSLSLAIEMAKALKPGISREFESFRGPSGLPDQRILDLLERGALIADGAWAGVTEDYRTTAIEINATRRKLYGKNAYSNPVSRWAVLFGTTLMKMGTVVETVPKVAADGYLKKHFPEMSVSDRTFYLRHLAGSPSFLTKGILSPILNNTLIFSTAIIQAYNSTYRNIKKNPKGILLNHVMASVPLRAIQWTLSSGALVWALTKFYDWDDDQPEEEKPELLKWAEYVKKIYDATSSQVKRNYLTVPIGIDENGKGVVFTLPQDEIVRAFGFFFEETMEASFSSMGISGDDRAASERIVGALDYTMGQFPGLNPVIGETLAWKTLLSGRNPEDSFRGGFRINQSQFEASRGQPFWSRDGRRVYTAMAKGTINNLGGSWLYRFDTSDPKDMATTLEKVLDVPLLGSNMLRRLIRVSDQGTTQLLREHDQQLRQEAASLREYRRDIARRMVLFGMDGNEPPSGTTAYVNRLWKQAPTEEEIATLKEDPRAERLYLRQARIRSSGSSYERALMFASSNEARDRMSLDIAKRDPSADMPYLLTHEIEQRAARLMNALPSDRRQRIDSLQAREDIASFFLDRRVTADDVIEVLGAQSDNGVLRLSEQARIRQAFSRAENSRRNSADSP